MIVIRMPLRLTCNQAGALPIARQDRQLVLADRLATETALSGLPGMPKIRCADSDAARDGAAMRQWRQPTADRTD